MLIDARAKCSIHHNLMNPRNTGLRSLVQSIGAPRPLRRCGGCGELARRRHELRSFTNPSQGSEGSQNGPKDRRRLYASLITLSIFPALYLFLPPSLRPTQRPQDISPQVYTSHQVTRSSMISDRHVLLEIAIPESSRVLFGSREAGEGKVDIQHICIKSPDLQIERPYTPINDVEKEGVIRVVVKRVRGGEVGRHIHSLKEGDQIEIRGPILTAMVPTAEYDHLTLISTGTGVAPFFQLLSRLSQSPSSPTATSRPSISLLHYLPLSPNLSEDLLQNQAVISGVSVLQGSAPGPLPNLQVKRFEAGYTLTTEDVRRSFTMAEGWEGEKVEAPRVSWGHWMRGRTEEVGQADVGRTGVMLCLPVKSLSSLVGQPPRGRIVPPLGGVLAELGMDRKNIWIL